MFSSRTLFMALICLTLFPMKDSMAQETRKVIAPPTARIEPFEFKEHGHVRVDNYYWLRERENPEVIRYLEAENAYTDAIMAHEEDFQEALFEEIKGRIKQTDLSVPYRMDDYYYYTRYENGKEYPIYCRKKGSLDSPEQVMLDVNEMAGGHGFFAVGPRAISSGQDLVAYPVDTVGRRIYDIHIKDLETGRVLPDVIPRVTSNIVWANDNKTLFYTRQDPETLRWYRIYRHVVGTDPTEDVLVYGEADETFECEVSKTKSKKYLLIASSQTLSTEYRYLDAGDPQGEFKVFLPRERDHEYHVDHYRDHFYIRTNDHAKNYRLMKTPVNATGRENWQEVIPHRDDVLLTGFEVFKDFLVLKERKNGLTQLFVDPWSGGEGSYIEFEEPAYLARTGDNYDIETPIVRFVYSSMKTPESVYDYNMVTRERVLLKQKEVLGGFRPEDYTTERLWATAKDGVKIPISLVYRNGIKRDGTNPLLLYGYGSYGISMDAAFRSHRLSLIDRGFIYAIAHIRGGQELGRYWYEDGKLLKKKNTFTDFIACSEYLVEEKLTAPDRLYALGGSAGGLLMGAIINMRPDLYRGVVAEVPFVDVITTMLDKTIPLTTGEYDEWGNPNDETYYDYMLSYSPYDNVAAQDYPNLLVTTGLHDSQVQYWEPAKWVARLRATKTDDNRLLLRTKMEAGHHGVSGRYGQYRELAFLYAFILDLQGITE